MPAAERRIVVLGAVVAVATIAFGYVYGFRGGNELGAPTPPFTIAWGPLADPLAVPAVVVVALCAFFAPRLRGARLPAAGFVPVVLLLALAAGVAVGSMRLGTYGWWHVFDLRPGGSFAAANEYLPGQPTLTWGVGFYLDRFAEMVPSQTVNIAGHPPGPLLLMRALSIDTAQGLAALCIACAALCTPLTYAIARAVPTSEWTARTAALLVALSPVVLLYGVTSFDAVYAAMGAAAAALLLSRRPTLVAVGVVAFAVATLFSWALLGIGAAAAIVVLGRDGWRRALVVAVACGVGVLVINAILAAGWGYDPIGTLLATEGVYRNSLAKIRPYPFWVPGSAVAWAVMLGPLTVAYALRGAVRRNPVAVGIVAVVLIAAVAGFTKAETERIWLIFVPLTCVAAAQVVPERRLPLVLSLLAAQALVLQLLVNTLW